VRLKRVLAAAIATGAVTLPASVASADTLNECASLQGHRYEVCFAYVVNDAHWSLQPYYKYVHSDSFLAPLADRLPLKYRGSALRTIRSRAMHWPRGTNRVQGPSIRILQARSSLKCNKARLVTRESWKVITPNGRVLYQEKNQLHTIVMRRVPDERTRIGGRVLLHAWVVSKIYDSRRSMSLTC
jgi:hypothetical protein